MLFRSFFGAPLPECLDEDELRETGITQVIVTYEVNMAKKVATKVVYMEQGHIIETGDSTCFEQPQTERFKQYLSHKSSPRTRSRKRRRSSKGF